MVSHGRDRGAAAVDCEREAVTETEANPPALDIQSVIYLNSADDILRAADFSANAVRYAREQGVVGSWRLLLGDCSPSPVLTTENQELLRGQLGRVGGTLVYRHFGENLGSAAGHNALAVGGDSELMVILNPDALMAYDTLDALVGALTPGVGIVESRQIPLEHPKDFDEGTGDTSWASTACALTTRAVFDEVGGFDSDTFFLYCDDVDYSWRLRIAGYRVRYEPAARLFHDKRLTPTGDWPPSSAEIYYSAEAALLLAHKYSRDDLVKSILAAFANDTDPTIAKAVAEFRRRVATHTTPGQIDHDHTVAEFVNGNYAIHRF
jgi:hypothetical protein